MSEIRRFTLMQGWRGGNCVGDTAGGLVHYDDHLAAVDDAVLAERERCAKIVEAVRIARDYGEFPDVNYHLAEDRIDSGEAPPAAPKFRHGQEVTYRDRGTRWGIQELVLNNWEWKYKLLGSNEVLYGEDELSLYDPPAPKFAIGDQVLVPFAGLAPFKIDQVIFSDGNKWKYAVAGGHPGLNEEDLTLYAPASFIFTPEIQAAIKNAKDSINSLTPEEEADLQYEFNRAEEEGRFIMRGGTDGD